MKDMVKWMASEESGQGMVEYGLIIALISVVLIVVLTGAAGELRTTFEKITNELKKANTTPTP